MGRVRELANHGYAFEIWNRGRLDSSTFELPRFETPRFKTGKLKMGHFKTGTLNTGLAENLGQSLRHLSIPRPSTFFPSCRHGMQFQGC